uniref:SET domain-containing protein n=1 Tax=Micromonas pusilla TaxID=38833 RepID=A0A7S0IFG5_MICPS|mmetsp:Transcript_4958/g.20212  ORF Transcript_4958/g.20212 Transcript_4958/m.20212 type:complete len:462 (+) Transcript_4958:41-1426(+)
MSASTRVILSRAVRSPSSSGPVAPPPSRRGAFPAARVMAAATASSEVDKAAALLAWLADATNDPGIESRVALGETRHGRGLVAVRNLVPGEVIFNVPFRLVLSEDHDEANASDLPWSALMAARLLEERHGERARWIESLPHLVSTPPLEYTELELAACEDPKTIAEARATSEGHVAAYEALRPRLDAVGCDERDLRWATGVLHSRCFTHGPRGTHLAVPGVDMCNHDFERANANVAVVTSPEDVQGVRATAEIADVNDEKIGPARGDGDEMFFQLRAGDDGVEQGEEVTISYGPWPNDPFYLYFGFVPEGNPNDAVVLFDDVDDIAMCAARLDMMSIAEAGERAAAATVAFAEEEKDGGSGAPTRMVITREGIDEGMMRACGAMGFDQDVFNALLEGRCRELLRSYPTKLKEDRELLMSGTLTENEATSTLYKMSKKEVLLGPLAAAAARQSGAAGTIIQA